MNYLRSLLKLYSFLSIRRKRQIYILIILLSIYSLLELLSIGSFIPLLATLVSVKQGSFNLPYPFNYFSEILDPDSFLILITFIFLSITLISASIRVFTAKKQWTLTYQITADISQIMFSKIINQGYDFFLKSKTVNITSSVNNNLRLLTGSTLIPIFNIVGAILVSLLLVLGLFLINASFGLLTLTIVALAYYFFLLSNKKSLKKNSQIVVDSDEKRQKILSESIGSIRDIIIDSSQEVYNAEFSENDSLYWKATSRSMFLGSYPRFILEGLSLSCFCIFSYLITSNSSSTTSIPAIGSFALAANKLLPAAQLIFFSISQMRFSAKAVQQVLELVEMPKVNIKKNCKKRDFHLLKLSHVDYSYPGQEHIKTLKDISLELRLGESLGIIGPSGSGKSTLLDLMLGLTLPNSGLITIDGLKINKDNVPAWRKCIAHVPQNIFLCNTTIAENIAFGEKKENIDYDYLEEVIKLSSMDSFINNKDGIFQKIGENGINLSGGQRQRIGIARALYKRAKFIFLDEATSALDEQTELEIMTSMYNLIRNEGISMVAISHKKSVLSKCSKIYKIVRGELIEI